MSHTLTSSVTRILSLYVRRKSCSFYRNTLILLKSNLLIWWGLLHKGGHTTVINEGCSTIWCYKTCVVLHVVISWSSWTVTLPLLGWSLLQNAATAIILLHNWLLNAYSNRCIHALKILILSILLFEVWPSFLRIFEAVHILLYPWSVIIGPVIHTVIVRLRFVCI